jgi:hypothetical protein
MGSEMDEVALRQVFIRVQQSSPRQYHSTNTPYSLFFSITLLPEKQAGET